MAHVQRIVRYYPHNNFRLCSSTPALSSDTANLTTAHDKGPTSDGSLTANGSKPVLPRDGAGPHYASSISVEDRRGDQDAKVASLPEPRRATTRAPISSRINPAPRMVKSAATSDEKDFNATEAEAHVTRIFALILLLILVLILLRVLSNATWARFPVVSLTALLLVSPINSCKLFHIVFISCCSTFLLPTLLGSCSFYFVLLVVHMYEDAHSSRRE